MRSLAAIVAAAGSGRLTSRVFATTALLVVLPACSKLVDVPKDPAQDHAPALVLNATPMEPSSGTAGDVEPDKITVSSSTTVKVTRGAAVLFVANASSPGGVMNLSIVGSKAKEQLFQTSASALESASGQAPSLIELLQDTESPPKSLQATINEPVTVVLTSTNFNKMSSSITVTYVPADFEVGITATPNTIGYQNPSSSTLSWWARYGKPPYKITLEPSVGISPVTSFGSASVSPSSLTVYNYTVTDQNTTRSAQATVSVINPPPPPSITGFNAAPNNGYNPLGTTDRITWSVANCSLPDCNVRLKGDGTGYASAEHTSLSHLGAQSSIPYVPKDITNFQLDATSQYGASPTKKLQLKISPSATSPPTSRETTYYFTILNNNPNATWTCSTVAVTAINEMQAETAALAQYGSGYSIGQSITEDQFNNGQGC